MIQKRDYLKALELIDNYHRQRDNIDKKQRVKILDFIKQIENVASVKLTNILHSINYDNENPLTYLDQLGNFKRFRGVGNKTYYEYIMLLEDLDLQNFK